MKHEQYAEMLGPYVLGILDQAEQQDLEAHLLVCGQCSGALTEFHNATACLAYCADPVSPPSALRSRILDAARARADVVSLDSRRLTHAPPTRRPPANWNFNRFGFIAASVLLAAFIGLWAYQANRAARLEQDLSQARQQLTRETLETAKLREHASWLASPQARNTVLSGTPTSPGAQAKLTYDPETGKLTITVTNLPPNPNDKAYQLWYIADGKPVPGLVFSVDARGRAELSDNIPTGGRQASLFAVTLEPAGGAASPTGDKYLLGSKS